MSRERGAVRVGQDASYAGRVAGAPRDLRVRLELRRDGRWRTVDRDVVSRGGRFHLEADVNRTGYALARVRVVNSSTVKGDSERVARVHGFRAAYASYYGPGLYGGALACGGRLSPGTIGVAHKTLPCGTRLTFRVGNRQVRARVIDRGPYVGGREFDLTSATRNALGFGDVGTVLVDR
ncbi:septal ring lytic transglycosylase RlpA family protein [Patulibacter defluvii]|uniref:septal ring lytic transglycosylase RlpA family protein n=1 Tax=Patulibacter defluvii TaxID=3095358 RepID=UPI002A760F89|nr:septal ring lytic transglycosylase RlpA family protein [Patulibacter sp. DM4]